MKNKQLGWVYAAMLAALVLVATLFIQIPLAVGYANMGDGLILAGAGFLGIYAAPAAAVGSALADLLLGYMVYIPATFVVKGAIGLAAGLLLKKCKRPVQRIALFALCEIWMVVGYFLFECVMYGAGAAVGTLLPNLMQGAVGLVVASALFPVTGRLKNLLKV